MSDPSIGACVLERYRIVRPLGRGGMGVVYLARTEGAVGVARPVVIKRLLAERSDDRESNEMFVREARILANLQHPNIVSVVEFGREQDGYVMVLEYVHGYDLHQWLRFVSRTRGRLNHEHVLYVVRKVLIALHHAHQVRLPDGTPANIVHRDVSLSNVLLDAGGQVKLHDFGIARMDGGIEARTQTGVFKGKLALAAPELLKGEKATRRSDIYTTGVMMHELLAGENPFKGKSEAETMFRIMEHVPPPVSTLFDDLPEGLDEILTCALQRDPDRRFQTAGQFVEALEALRTRPDEAVLSDLARQLRDDFASIPQTLGLESLTAREAAWRAAQDGAVSSEVPLISSPPPEPVGRRRVGASTRPQQRFTVDVPPHVLRPEPGRHMQPAIKTMVRLSGLGLAALAVLFFAMERGPVEATPRNLASERPAVVVSAAPDGQAPAGAAATTAPPESTPSPAAAATPKVPSRKGPGPSAKPLPVRPNAVSLSRQFKTHQPKLEACFRRNAEEIQGRPQVSIRFEVDRAGKVNHASLSPAALEGTKLGRCLLGVATAARFATLTEPVAFGIPITAHIGGRGE